MKDKVITQKVKISNSYESRKGQTYEELGTKSEDWTACRIIGYHFIDGVGEIPDYEIPSGYQMAITRFTEFSRCNLCGAEITFHHFIKHDEKKMFMQVGCECVHNRYGRVVKKIIKEFKDNETRQKGKEFLIKFIEWCKTQKEYRRPKTTFEAEALKYGIYMEKLKAEKMLRNFDSISVRKIANFIKKHEHDLEIPGVIQNWDSCVIKNGDDLVEAHSKKQFERIVEFGMHKGKLLKDIPESYVEWMIKNQRENR